MSLPVKHFELSKPLDVRGGLGATPPNPPTAGAGQLRRPAAGPEEAPAINYL